MAHIVARTKDVFAVAVLWEWEARHNVDTMAITQSDDSDWVRVILYGMDSTDPLFREFWKIVNAADDKGDLPWVPSSIDPAELSEIVIEPACEDWWHASFVSLPDVFLGGPTAAKATAALCRDFGVDLLRLVPRKSDRNDKILMHVRPQRARACPDCRGIGISIHDEDTEVCEACSGSGMV